MTGVNVYDALRCPGSVSMRSPTRGIAKPAWMLDKGQPGFGVDSGSRRFHSRKSCLKSLHHEISLWPRRVSYGSLSDVAAMHNVSVINFSLGSKATRAFRPTRCRAEADKPRVVSERSHHADYHRAPLVSETQTYSGDQSVLQCATLPFGGHGLSVSHQIDLIGAVRAGGRSDSDEDDKPSHLVSQPSHRSILPPR
jgi:hypothetical protein